MFSVLENESKVHENTGAAGVGVPCFAIDLASICAPGNFSA